MVLVIVRASRMVDAFWTNRVWFRLVGITFPGEINRKWLRSIVDLFLIFNNVVVATWAILYFRGAYLFTKQDFMNRMVGVAAAISVPACIAKYIVFRIKGDVLQELMKTLGDFQCTTKRGLLVRKVTRIYEGSVLAIIVTHNMHPLFETFHRSTPYFSEYIGGPPKEVAVDFSFSLYAAICTLFGNVFGDTLFLTMTSQLCHKLYLLGNTMECIGKPWDAGREDVMQLEGEVTDQVLIRACVKEHNRLLRLKEEMEKLFSTIILVQLAYSFADTCITLFCISMFENVMEAIQELSPQFVALFLEIFLYCWGGEMLKGHFKALHDASYGSEWYNSDPKVKSSLVVIQSFTTKPIILAAAIFHFDFHFYETICKETFSYYTVMSQLIGQK